MRYKVFVSIKDTDDIMLMISWCNGLLGTIDVDWSWSYVDDSDLNSDVDFYFKKRKNAEWFTLRWL